ncbi:hypothetical protein [Duganella aceris]|uniref:Outer membrane beta-barrel protein n=1 Tax=Duganella aceris TaxID=2703883 RepID=A0ABX0FKC8_9BURK|nr:hypothetical protein [Duganella aceris]NGZ84976.1 hypothetical protein [Duganella aceris]
MILTNLPSRRRAKAAACALALLPLTAHAGRPMTVDDAAIVAPGLCQLETYALHDARHNEYWATPACNIGGDWELGIGRSGGGDAHYGRVQAKTVFKPLETGGWGIGLVLADQFRSGRGLEGDVSANVPLSISLAGDSVLVHFNTGLMRTRAQRSTDAIWGVGAEFKLNERNSLTAEVFGQQRNGSRYQLGFAHALIPDRLQVDASWSRRLTARGAGEQAVTLGLILQSN